VIQGYHLLMLDDYTQLLKPVLALAQQAGAAVMQIYNQDAKTEVTLKADHTPLTTADVRSHEILTAGLQQLTPGIPVLSEESVPVPFAERKKWQQYWLIDPVDGTTEFIERTGEFVINIALIEGHVPVLGMIYVPISNIAYEATRGCGAFKHTAEGTYEFISSRPSPHPNPPPCSSTREGTGGDGRVGVTVTVSRRYGQGTRKLLEQFANYELLLRGSALKFGLLAEGSADVYPRLGPTSEWDTAAGQCILEEAGGKVVDFFGAPLRYNTKDSLENPAFIAMGDATLTLPSPTSGRG
jgi:3'(2'), 5'-bisphosphate nucleotidase